MPWTYAEPNDDGELPPRRRRLLRPGDRHLEPGRVQRRRHLPGRGGLPAALAADRRQRQPRPGLRPAPRADLPADHDRRRTPATSCSGCSPTAPSTPAPSPSSCPTRPTATRRTGWPARSGRSARATRRSPTQDPAFAAFLRDRLELSVDAVDRQVLDAYGQYLDIDGERTPAWLIADGADATAEAVLGLSAYVDAGGAGGDSGARQALDRLAEGVAMLTGGDAQTWPFGAVRPWALSRSIWHGWGSQMPAALAEAVRHARRPGAAARRDQRRLHLRPVAAHLRRRRQRPAADARRRLADRVRRRLAAAVAARHRRGARPAACCATSQGSSAPGTSAPTPPASRCTTPPPAAPSTASPPTGEVNHNSGAESTIHGLLSMLALDEHPDVADAARIADDHPARGHPHPRGRGRHAGAAAPPRSSPSRCGPGSRCSAAPGTPRSAPGAPSPCPSRVGSGPWCSRSSTSSPAATRSRPSAPADGCWAGSPPAPSAPRATRPRRGRCCR